MAGGTQAQVRLRGRRPVFGQSELVFGVSLDQSAGGHLAGSIALEPPAVLQVRNGRLDLPADLTPQQIAQHCWDHFEPELRREPGLWMWPYKHFRYRPRSTQQPYPFYANESGAFEKLRKQEGA